MEEELKWFVWFAVVLSLLGSCEFYLKHAEKMEAIRSGLVQDKDGHWVKPQKEAQKEE